MLLTISVDCPLLLTTMLWEESVCPMATLPKFTVSRSTPRIGLEEGGWPTTPSEVKSSRYHPLYWRELSAPKSNRIAIESPSAAMPVRSNVACDQVVPSTPEYPDCPPRGF